jgi:1-acyl-sn-glycerol-3-phosphate acyltransferase
MCLLYLECPSFVAKAEVRNYPGVGKIAEGIQSIFLNRGDSKEKRIEALEEISSR